MSLEETKEGAEEEATAAAAWRRFAVSSHPGCTRFPSTAHLGESSSVRRRLTKPAGLLSHRATSSQPPRARAMPLANEWRRSTVRGRGCAAALSIEWRE